MNIFRTFGGASNEPTLKVQGAKLDEMNFAFIDMGQGDCTVISCPDNSLLIVDCGSSGGLEEKPFNVAKKLVRSWSKGKPVDMIMTHPDKDHYNKFIDLMVVSTPKVKANVIYFSKALKDNSPLGNYKETALMRNIYHFGKPLLIEVTLNSTDNYKKTWTSLFDYEDPIQTDIPKAGYVIKNGITSNGTPWSITIIAGNVKTSSNVTSTKSNVVSICTLVQMGSDKLLLTGDSTDETLAYLYAKHKQQIVDLAIFQVPHHGSESSLPTTAFKNWVEPQTLLVSVGLLNDSYNLPRYTVVESWLATGRLRKMARTYDYWTEGAKGYKDYKDLKKILDVKWKKYAVDRNSSGTFFWLRDPKDAVKSGTGFYGFTNKGYFLYRQETSKDLYQTGIIGSLFDEDFIED